MLNPIFGPGLYGLMQYSGDPKLYKAATSLLPEERPKHPVKLRNPEEVYRFQKFPKTEAIISDRDKQILINRQSPTYQGSDPRMLAGLLGHEAEHFAQPDHFNERPAYAKQAAILRRLGLGRDVIRAYEKAGEER